MNCPACNNPRYDRSYPCSNCGFDLANSAWMVIATVSPPDDALLESLIESFGIPVRLIHSAGSILGISVGPLGEVKVAVPELFAEKVHDLLQAEFEHDPQ